MSKILFGVSIISFTYVFDINLLCTYHLYGEKKKDRNTFLFKCSLLLFENFLQSEGHLVFCKTELGYCHIVTSENLGHGEGQ